MAAKQRTALGRKAAIWLVAVVILLAVAAAAFWGTSPGLGHVAATAAYKLGAYWTGDGIPGGALFRPIGVAVAPDGSVYVTDARRRVVRFRPSGTFLGAWGGDGNGKGEFSNPVGIAAAPDGSVYVSDYDQDRVQKFTADGKFLLQFGSHGSQPGQFNAPAGLAVGRTGRVYVADFYNNRIEEFSAEGKLLRVIGVPGRVGMAALHYPTGVAALPAGDILVADAYNYELQWFTESGDAFREVGYRLFSAWPRPATGLVGFNAPTDAAVGPHGRISVADSANHRVVMLSPDGKFETAWKIPNPVREIFSPEHIAVSADGKTVYATDFAANRLIVLNIIPFPNVH